MDLRKTEPKVIIIAIIVIVILIVLIYKIIYIIPIILVTLLILQYRDKFIHLTSSKAKQNNEYKIEDGVFYDEKNANAVLIIDDIQMDYRDTNDANLRSYIASFHKILDIAKNVNIILRREYINKNEYITSLAQKIQSLRIMIDSDPSNEKAKRKLELMESIISKIEAGESPFKYEMYIIITSGDKGSALATASTIKQGLEGLGIKSRFATSYEIRKYIRNFFRLGLNSNKILLPSTIPYLTPISMEKRPKYNLVSNGILLGREIDGKNLIFWNIDYSQNSHVLLIGPTGSGKTEFIIWISTLLNLIYGNTVVLFDIKGDIKYRLSKYKVPFHLINPLFYKLGLLDEYEMPLKLKLLQIEKILINSFRLNKFQASIIYTYLNRLLDSSPFKHRIKWKDLEKYIDEINDLQLKYYFNKLISILSSLDDSDLPSLLSGINENEINVIDLTLIKNEEIRRLLVYTILQESYNKMSLNKMYDIPKMFLVMDEAWTILRSESEDYPIVADLIKRGRGHGISIIMATQNLEDLGELANVYLDNIGLLVFINNGDRKFWEEVKRFVTIDDNTLHKSLMFLSKGEAVIRFLGDPRPVIIKLYTLANSPL